MAMGLSTVSTAEYLSGKPTIIDATHGTHTGGTIAATRDNGVGVVGVGSAAGLVAFGAGERFSDSETAESLDYLTYLSRAYGYRVARVIAVLARR